MTDFPKALQSLHALNAVLTLAEGAWLTAKRSTTEAIEAESGGTALAVALSQQAEDDREALREAIDLLTARIHSVTAFFDNVPKGSLGSATVEQRIEAVTTYADIMRRVDALTFLATT